MEEKIRKNNISPLLSSLLVVSLPFLLSKDTHTPDFPPHQLAPWVDTNLGYADLYLSPSTEMITYLAQTRLEPLDMIAKILQTCTPHCIKLVGLGETHFDSKIMDLETTLIEGLANRGLIDIETPPSQSTSPGELTTLRQLINLLNLENSSAIGVPNVSSSPLQSIRIGFNTPTQLKSFDSLILIP